MCHAIFLLQSGGCSQLLRGQEVVVVDRREYPAELLELKGLGYLFHLDLVAVFEEAESADLVSLRRLLDGFHHRSHPLLLVWIFGLLPLQEPHSLLSHLLALPVSDESLQFVRIHKLDIIHVPLFLLR